MDPVQSFEADWEGLLRDRNFREQRLTVDERRLERARRFVWSMSRPRHQRTARVATEMRVTSRSGNVVGTIDRVRTGHSGEPQLFEVKTGALTADLLSTYRRQLVSYAYLLAETGGGLASRGALLFVLAGGAIRQRWTETEVATQGAVLEDAATEALGVKTAQAAQGLVGEECWRCDYRPWCPAFWAVYRRNPKSFDSSRPLPGVEMKVRERIESRGQFLVTGVVDEQPVDLLLSGVDYPHAQQIAVGSSIRATDVELPALGPVKLRMTRMSELFLISSPPPNPSATRYAR